MTVVPFVNGLPIVRMNGFVPNVANLSVSRIAEDCEYWSESTEHVEADDCDDYSDCYESPQVIIWIDWSDHPDYTGKED